MLAHWHDVLPFGQHDVSPYGDMMYHLQANDMMYIANAMHDVSLRNIIYHLQANGIKDYFFKWIKMLEYKHSLAI